MAVMDNRNNDIKNPKPTDINTSLKTCLVNAMAFHGLGINVYAGEDTLMFDEDNQEEKSAETKVATKTAPKRVTSETALANDRQKTEIRAAFKGLSASASTELRKELLIFAKIKLPEGLSTRSFRLDEVAHLLTEKGAEACLRRPTF